MSVTSPSAVRLTPSAVAGLIRAPFLILAPVCVALGWASAVSTGAITDPSTLALVLLGALSAHIAVNTLNEHEDFHSGLDLLTARTPFSGGSGTLPEQPGLAPWARRIGWTALVVTLLVGLLLTPRTGPGLWLLGGVGVALIYTYTRWLNRWPWLCLVAPGTGFGLLMVPGTYWALQGQLDGVAWAAALVPFFLVNNLLLLNQLPDIEADRRIGRRTFPIVYGEPWSLLMYGVFSGLAYGWLILGWVLDWWSVWSLAGLVTAPLALHILRGMRSSRYRAAQRVRYLGLNVVLVLTTPLLMAAGLVLGP